MPIAFPVGLHSHAAVEVHSVDTNRRVVLDAQINVFADTEAEVASLREVALPQLIFLDLQASLENFLCLRTADSDVDGDFLVTTDTECSHSVAGLAYQEKSAMGLNVGRVWQPYCRPEFDHSIVPTPSRHE